MKLHEFTAELFSNWPVKLFSIAAAVVLYFSYQLISLDSKSFSLPLQVREGGNFVLTESAPQYVRVTVRAKTDKLAVIQKSDIQAYIDTSSVTAAGPNSLQVKLELKDFFTLMEPLDIQVKPHTLLLSFEKNAYKVVPLKPLFFGTPAEGFEVSSWTVSPAAVKISGPESITESTSEVYTGTIDLRGRKTGFKAPITVEKSSKRIEILDVPDATIKVEIAASLGKRTFPNLPVGIFNLNGKLQTAGDMPKVSLVLSGGKKALEAFVPDNTTVQADFTDIDAAGTYSVPLRIYIPDEFSVVGIEPPLLKVELSENKAYIPSSENDDDFSVQTQPVFPAALAMLFEDAL
ncbi:CdaR family protein [Treponema sp. HNW]|uniref:CdaR family protein n=1 Tax=Treponema sp. HNW TaxID=3116654 RepID=UPI003D11987C